MDRRPLHAGPTLPPDLALDVRRHRRWLAVCRGYARWLRVRTRGLEHVPVRRPVLLVGNHAGLRSLDHMALQAAVTDATGRLVRGLAHGAAAPTRPAARPLTAPAAGPVGPPPPP